MRAYRFNVGDKVRIHATKTSSVGVKEYDGKVVTIKSRCKFTWAYEPKHQSPGWSLITRSFWL